MSCENDIEKIKLITSRVNLPVEQAKNAKITYTDSAVIRLRLDAAMLDKYDGEKSYIEITKGLKIVFYNKQGKESSRLTANQGISYEKEGKMEVRGNIVLVNEKGEKLNTEHLVWLESEEKVFSDEFVKITTPDEIIMGTGFESNQDFTWFKIKNIKGTVVIEN